jgi:hypothetical protein
VSGLEHRGHAERPRGTSHLGLAFAVAVLALPLSGCGLILGIEELSVAIAPGWSRIFGASSARQTAQDLVLTAGGNVVVTGSYQGAVSFGGAALPSSGIQMVLASYEGGGGIHRWSAVVPNVDGGQAPSARLAADGDDILVAGGFYNRISIGNTALLQSAGAADLFAARLDAGGNGVWARQFGGPGDQQALDVDAASGQVALAGGYQVGLTIGPTPLPYSGAEDLVVAKLDGAGGLHVWDHGFGGVGDERAERIAAGPEGEVVIAGAHTQAFVFGAGMTTTGAFFLARLLPSGDPEWITTFGPSGGHVGGVAVDPAGNVIVAGHFLGTFDLGDPLTSGGAADSFVVKLDAAGTPLWSLQLGGAGDQRCWGLHVDAAGAITLVGDFEGSLQVGGTTLQSAGGLDIYVARLDSDGNALWGASFGGPGAQAAQAVAADAEGNVYLTGQLEGAIDFGHGLLETVGTADLFVAKIGPPEE